MVNSRDKITATRAKGVIQGRTAALLHQQATSLAKLHTTTTLKVVAISLANLVSKGILSTTTAVVHRAASIQAAAHRVPAQATGMEPLHRISSSSKAAMAVAQTSNNINSTLQLHRSTRLTAGKANSNKAVTKRTTRLRSKARQAISPAPTIPMGNSSMARTTSRDSLGSLVTDSRLAMEGQQIPLMVASTAGTSNIRHLRQWARTLATVLGKAKEEDTLDRDSMAASSTEDHQLPIGGDNVGRWERAGSQTGGAIGSKEDLR